MRKFLFSLAIIFSLATVLLAQLVKHFDGSSWWDHVKFLADDKLEGRETGSEGLRKAEAYVAEQLAKAGLQPAGIHGFYQPVILFPVKSLRRTLRLRWFPTVSRSRWSSAKTLTSTRARTWRPKKSPRRWYSSAMD